MIFKSILIIFLSPNLSVFTFQSGDIQIKEECDKEGKEYEFTFQSGDIQIGLNSIGIKSILYIYIPIWWYSNPYNVALNTFNVNIYIPIWWYSNFTTITYHLYISAVFTFQSGDIQIEHAEKTGNSLLSFTFQSGDIQM